MARARRIKLAGDLVSKVKVAKKVPSKAKGLCIENLGKVMENQDGEDDKRQGHDPPQEEKVPQQQDVSSILKRKVRPEKSRFHSSKATHTHGTEIAGRVQSGCPCVPIRQLSMNGMQMLDQSKWGRETLRQEARAACAPAHGHDGTKPPRAAILPAALCLCVCLQKISRSSP